MKASSILIAVCFCMVTSVHAQRQERRFDPAKFETDLEQYITNEAKLSQQEAARFFPIYKEMRRKHKALFDQARKWRHIDANNEEQCENAIRQQDNTEVQIKQLQKDYHAKFLKVLSASKVYSIIKAENDFHRQAFKNVAKRGHRR